jgi:hypothetical protein
MKLMVFLFLFAMLAFLMAVLNAAEAEGQGGQA